MLNNYQNLPKITKKGNPNIRFLNKNGDFYLRVTMGNRKFKEYKLFVPEKFEKQLLSLFGFGNSYNVCLLKKDEQHYRVVIDYEVENPNTIIDFSEGIIGIDVNPDRVAISEITNDGNLVKSLSIVNNRMFFSSTNKRDYEIGCIVKQVINYALRCNKGIVFENLKFKKDFENQGTTMIICAAIKKGDKIFTGHRHGDIAKNNPDENFSFLNSTQGFMTDDGKFVNRKEAAKIAWECKQTKRREKLLVSEDLY